MLFFNRTVSGGLQLNVSVNPYQSPREPPETEPAETVLEPVRSITALARLSSIAGAFAGATYGAVTGLAVAVLELVRVGVRDPGAVEALPPHVFAFSIGLAIVGTIAGVCNGAIIGTFDGIALGRLDVRYKHWLLLANIVAFGWLSGYQAHVESPIAANYLSQLVGVEPSINPNWHWTAAAIGALGGTLTARSLVRTLVRIRTFGAKPAARPSRQ